METKDKIKEAAQELLNKLEIESSVEVVLDETEAFRVNIETPETGLLIGFHGQTLESFQIILNLIMSKKLGSWHRIYVNVGDYREKREEALMHMAMQAADRVNQTGRPVEMANLTGGERRVIHLTLSGDNRVVTESDGEGRFRKLIVSPAGKETTEEEKEKK